jgi:hypothetical protein
MSLAEARSVYRRCREATSAIAVKLFDIARWAAIGGIHPSARCGSARAWPFAGKDSGMSGAVGKAAIGYVM